MSRVDESLSIRRRYLHDDVAEGLRELIRTGELEPRARVNEVALTERFGISRTPLREAIKILATEGLLELLPNKGARVASVTPEELAEVLEVVAGLEATAADLACRSITDGEIAAIEAKHAVMLEAWRQRDEIGYFTRNREIHEALVAAARNATLSGIYANLSGRIQRTRYSAHKTPEQWLKAVAEHEVMLRLLRARDGEKLAAIMREHVRGKAGPILASYGGSATPAKPPPR